MSRYKTKILLWRSSQCLQCAICKKFSRPVASRGGKQESTEDNATRRDLSPLVAFNMHHSCTPLCPYSIIFLPRQLQAVLREKLKYAIHFCKSIDTDDYARVAMTGAGVEDNVSSESDTDDWDSIGNVSTTYRHLFIPAIMRHAL
ncbi:E3 ubiquitin-protein ligase HERC2 [Chionoecetes opilio]|uniref:E3 ubiquitin-protein ligase HERC2 n=1 Tax=Chionoecetes opilio TaxID=41210 RepID=A0A8J4XZT1_CHIOP|nr:E3 ubiquitin-protein ligase HERC2 [Chionoecetes opilio]